MEGLANLGASARTVAGVIKRSPRVAARTLRAHQLRRQVNAAWSAGDLPAPQAHGLPGELIVSLTSYRPRFSTLALTLKCLLAQTVRADRTILWIDHRDREHVPPDVRALEPAGLEIGCADGLRSYTKIVPALRAAPGSFIVTADDDVYYPPLWLEELVRAWRPDTREIICHRAHGIRLGRDGTPIPYTKWEQDARTLDPSALLLATGVGGVLYPPGSLDAQVTDQRVFQALCPYADDLWLYFMGRRAGSVYRRVGPRRPMISWPGSQETSLLAHNVGQARGNDVQMANLIDHFGFPAPTAATLETSPP